MKIFVILLCILAATSLSFQSELNETIQCIDDYVQTFKGKMSSAYFDILVKAFPNTMSTTVQHYNLEKGNESTYIITGDIEAMWLRDSTNQFIPYIRMPKNCTYMPALTRGLLNTQAEFILIDVYTNAFKKFQDKIDIRPSYLNDRSETLFMGIPVDLCRKRQFATKNIWERKFQIDSPASFLRLAHQYYLRFNQTDFITFKFLKAINRILSLLKQESVGSEYERKINKQFYTFYRTGNDAELPSGRISYAVQTGMIKTGFRPSDSPNVLPFNIPGNAFMSSYLLLVANDILSKIPQFSVYSSWAKNLSKRMKEFAQQINKGINTHGLVRVNGEDMYAYEVDGMGNYRLYDDSNVPSLLSLPYLKYVDISNPIYQTTRKFILSPQDKYFYSRGDVNGVGSSHTPTRYIWPLALIAQILTSTSNNEIKNCLASLVKSAKNNLMHQSFLVDDPTKITREWFAWANSFYGEMIMHLAVTNPNVLK